MRPTQWVLFLDESGQFDLPDESVCVAGLLLQADDGVARRGWLREPIERAVPWAPWPPHAAWLRRPSYVAWCLMRPEARVPEGAAAAVEFVKAAGDPAPRSVVASAAKGERPSWNEVAASDAWLEANGPQHLSALAAEWERARGNLQAFLEHLAGQLGPEGCLLVAATEERGGERASAPDRYLALLEVALERVFAFLRARPPEDHLVWVSCATRHVRGLPVPGVPLRSADVADAIRKAERFPLFAPERPTDPHVRLIPALPEVYGPSVHPGIVLADFIANQVRGSLAGARSWQNLRVRLRAAGMPFERKLAVAPTQDPLPSPCVDGQARAAVSAAFAGAAEPGLPSRLPGWSREVAARWAAAAARARKGGEA